MAGGGGVPDFYHGRDRRQAEGGDQRERVCVPRAGK